MGLQDDYGKRYPYNLKSNKDNLVQAKSELCNFINGMTPLKSGSSELQTWLENNMDIDLFLRAYAVNVMVGMWDDYWKNKNNYYFYFDSNHRFYFIPFDYDNTLGSAQESYGNPGTDDMLNWGSLGGDRILMRKVMSINDFREKYKGYIKELATSSALMEPAAASARIAHLQSLIREYITNDTGEDCKMEDKPAYWSSCPNYRLLTGNAGNGKSSESNFFKTKAAAINW
jgi:spore coat protein CotH